MWSGAASGKVKAAATDAFVVTVRAPHLRGANAAFCPHAIAGAAATGATPPSETPPVAPTCRPAAVGYGSSPLEVAVTYVLGYVGQAWGSRVDVTTTRLAWTATVEGALPPGISSVADDFVGTPQAAGVYRFSLVVTDQVGNSQTLPVCFQFADPLRLTTSIMPTAQVGQAYDEVLPLVGGFLPLTLDEVWQPDWAGTGSNSWIPSTCRGRRPWRAPGR